MENRSCILKLGNCVIRFLCVYARKRGAGYVHYAPTKERPIRFWRSLCLEKNEREKQTDRRSSNCVRLRELKKASRFASWSQRRSNSTRSIVYEERRRRCCYSPFFPLSSFSRGARSHAHKTPRSSQAKPSWERSNSGGLSLLHLLLPSLPVSRTLPGQREHVAHIVCRKHSPLQHPLVPSFFLLYITWILFLFFVLCLVANERERISFVKILFFPIHQSVVSFAEIFSQLPLDYLGFLIIHRLSLSILKMHSVLSIPLKVLNAVLSISISFSNATQSIVTMISNRREKERDAWWTSAINAIIRLRHFNIIRRNSKRAK